MDIFVRKMKMHFRLLHFVVVAILSLAIFLFSVFRRFQALKTCSLALARKTENKKPQEAKLPRQQNVTTKKIFCGHTEQNCEVNMIFTLQFCSV